MSNETKALQTASQMLHCIMHGGSYSAKDFMDKLYEIDKTLALSQFQNPAEQWKDGEVQYCGDLVQTKGSREVPAASVTAYLELQLHDAVKDGCIEAAQALLQLRNKWEGKR